MKHKLLRFSWLLLFLCAATTAILYIQGWRIFWRQEEILPTGILQLSSLPANAAVFIDGIYRGATPLLLRGQPLRETAVRLERNGFLPLKFSTPIAPDLITALPGLILTPRFPEATEYIWGAATEIFWTADFAEAVRISPTKKTLEFVNLLTAEHQIEEISNLPTAVRFLANNEVEVVFIDGSLIIVANPFPQVESLPQNTKKAEVSAAHIPFSHGEFYFVDEVHRMRWSIRLPATTILGAWRATGSSDILLCTTRGALLWNTVLQEKRELLSTKASAEIAQCGFFAPSAMLLYKESEIWRSIRIGLEQPFSQGGEF